MEPTLVTLSVQIIDFQIKNYSYSVYFTLAGHIAILKVVGKVYLVGIRNKTTKTKITHELH